jgi:HD superfamily phosphohydrolase
VDSKRLINCARVVDNQICYNQKEAYNLYEVFHVRYSLFKRVYTHKVGKAVEFMITDALVAADSVLGISSAVKDMKKYLYLDDTILNEIEKSKGIISSL